MIRHMVACILTVQAALLAGALYASVRLDAALHRHALAEARAFENLATVIRQTWYIHEQAIAEIEAREARQQPPPAQ